MIMFFSGRNDLVFVANASISLALRSYARP